jgi:hypothetical protein
MKTPHPGQWRLARIELVNWGTFQEHRTLDVARKGFLLTGASGSGRSTWSGRSSATGRPTPATAASTPGPAWGCTWYARSSSDKPAGCPYGRESAEDLAGVVRHAPDGLVCHVISRPESILSLVVF